MKSRNHFLAFLLSFIGLLALCLPFLTLVFSLPSFSTWDQADLVQKAYAIWVLFAFTGFASMPALVLFSVSIWLVRKK